MFLNTCISLHCDQPRSRQLVQRHGPVEELARAKIAVPADSKQLGAHDLIVASTALALDLSLATGDQKAFERIPGLRIVRT